MEVHHHPQLQHKPKPWKEYILEYIMIVLAVTTGFIAENIREHRSYREKEKQQMESFAKALETDKNQLKAAMRMNDTIIGGLKTFLSLKDSEKIDGAYRKKFYESCHRGFGMDIYFKSNDAPLQEMKSSGIIGALAHRSIADSIFRYQQNTVLLQQQENDCYFIFKESMSLVMNNVDVANYFDGRYMSPVKLDDNFFSVIVNEQNELEVPKDPKLMKVFYSHAASLIWADQAYLDLLKTQLACNERLSMMIREEYDLK